MADVTGEWIEVARECCGFDADLLPWQEKKVNTLARAMAMVAEETRQKVQQAIIKRSLEYQDSEPLVVIAQVNDAEIISGLMARLKSEKGTE